MTGTDIQLRGVIPTFRVRDASAAEAFYCDKLGFKTSWEYDPGDGYPVFVEVVRDNVALHLSEHEGDGPEGISIYVNVADARALYGDVLAAGAEVPEPPQEAEWGEIVFSLIDPDGNTLRFGSPTASD